MARMRLRRIERQRDLRHLLIEPVKPAVQDRQAEITVDDAMRFYAECRALGHAWRHRGRIEHEAIPLGSHGFLSVCEHCTTERRKFITTTGVQTRYTYPKGYARRGPERLSSLQWRRVLVVTL